MPFEEAATHAEQRAAMAELRYLEGFPDSVRRLAGDRPEGCS